LNNKYSEEKAKKRRNIYFGEEEGVYKETSEDNHQDMRLISHKDNE
jgi:hypothetical protein